MKQIHTLDGRKRSGPLRTTRIKKKSNQITFQVLKTGLNRSCFFSSRNAQNGSIQSLNNCGQMWVTTPEK